MSGKGVADLLIERLVNAGYRVVERQEIETILFERGLNPLLTGDLAQAARLVGADGTILLDLGRAHGVRLHDLFEVHDPATGASIEERVSLANKLGDFSVRIGDLVSRKET